MDVEAKSTKEIRNQVQELALQHHPRGALHPQRCWRWECRAETENLSQCFCRFARSDQDGKKQVDGRERLIVTDAV